MEEGRHAHGYEVCEGKDGKDLEMVKGGRAEDPELFFRGRSVDQRVGWDVGTVSLRSIAGGRTAGSVVDARNEDLWFRVPRPDLMATGA